MHPADIKALIEKAGSSQTAIARSMKGRGGEAMRVATVHAVIKSLGKSQRVAAAISKVTGVPVKQLWPGRYPDLEKAQAFEAAGGVFPRLPGERSVDVAAPPPATKAQAPKRPAVKRG